MKWLSNSQEKLQVLGRALMLPIAVLPVAALMLRLGQADLLDVPFIAAAGNAIFAHLGLLFAIGVSVGIARENHGAAGLAGVVAYLVLTEGAKVNISPGGIATIPASLETGVREVLINAWKEREMAKLSVPAGILSGLAAGYLYNRFHAIKLPDYLSFFGGRRFVPIAAGIFGLFAAAIFGFGFPILESGIDRLSGLVTASGSIGLFAYGLLNRLLIVTGLHHILNNLAWFVLGDFNGTAGDLNRFFAGDPSAGAFMTGFYPVMMFGLPGACLAMWQRVRPERRRAMAGMYLSMALTSLFTGVTEPIEFTFMFVAPVLFVMHAILTGVSMVLMDLLNIRLGFGFSAGLFDYVLNFQLGTNPWYILPIGIVYFLIYYGTFSFAIGRFGIRVPGTGVQDDPALSDADAQLRFGSTSLLGQAYLAALGGAGNLKSINACTTRLRLVLNDPRSIDEHSLRLLGAKGIIVVGGSGLQVIIGPDADRIAGEMREFVNADSAPDADWRRLVSSKKVTTDERQVPLEILGGHDNISSINRCGSRHMLSVVDRGAVQFDKLNLSYPGRWVEPSAGCIHLVLE